MAWTLEFSPSALRTLRGLDPQTNARILGFLKERVAPRQNPRGLGAALHGQKYKDLWRYRVGDYRILAEIKDDIVTILVVEVGHRKEVYR